MSATLSTRLARPGLDEEDHVVTQHAAPDEVEGQKVGAADGAGARRVALVTGGSRGIGAAVAEQLAGHGYDLVLTYASRADAAEQVAARCRLGGALVHVVQADFSVAGAPGAVLAAVDEAGLDLHLLVNNAGLLPPLGSVADITPERALRTLTVNTLAPLEMARLAVARMRLAGRGGVVVNVSSRAAVRGGSGEFVDYAMSKAALDSLTVGLAGEVGAENIRVVGVRPGLIATDMNTGPAAGGRLARLVTGVPLGRAGTAHDVAEAICWLASDAASYITGATLDVSGGR